jgi:hypothetical protein
MASIETFHSDILSLQYVFHLTRAESQAAMMVSVLQGFGIGLSEIRQVDVVVDTINRKAYFHHPLISQEQPHSMRMFV